MLASLVFAASVFGLGATTDPAASSEVNNFFTTAVTSTSFRVNWTPPTFPKGIVRGYNLYLYYYVGASRIFIGKTTTEDTFWLFTDLTPSTRYEVHIGPWTLGSSSNVLDGQQVFRQVTTKEPDSLAPVTATSSGVDIPTQYDAQAAFSPTASSRFTDFGALSNVVIGSSVTGAVVVAVGVILLVAFCFKRKTCAPCTERVNYSGSSKFDTALEKLRRRRRSAAPLPELPTIPAHYYTVEDGALSDLQDASHCYMELLEPHRYERLSLTGKEMSVPSSPSLLEVISVSNSPAYLEVIPVPNSPAYLEVIPVPNIPAYLEVIPVPNSPASLEVIPVPNSPAYLTVIP